VKIVIIALFICSIFVLGMGKPACDSNQKPSPQTKSWSSEEKEGVVSDIEKEADLFEKKMDEFSIQLEKAVDIFIEKYNEIMPKLKEAGARMQEKIQELLKKTEEEK